MATYLHIFFSFSAVDAHVGRHIFEEVISSQTGVLKEKSRLWVTNQVTYLSNVDQVIVLKDGQILEQGIKSIYSLVIPSLKPNFANYLINPNPILGTYYYWVRVG